MNRTNDVIISSPGIEINDGHCESKPFSDEELVAIKKWISATAISECPDDTTAVALHRFLGLLEAWQVNSP